MFDVWNIQFPPQIYFRVLQSSKEELIKTAPSEYIFLSTTYLNIRWKAFKISYATYWKLRK